MDILSKDTLALLRNPAVRRTLDEVIESGGSKTVTVGGESGDQGAWKPVLTLRRIP